MVSNQNLSVLAASKLYGMSRQTLYKSLKNGNISKNKDGSLNLSELIRVFGEPSTYNQKTVLDTAHSATKDTNLSRGKDSAYTSKDTVIALQQEKIKYLEMYVRKLEEQESYLKSQIAVITDTVKRLEHVEPVKRKGILGRLLGG
jgi:hypothetical protein